MATKTVTEQKDPPYSAEQAVVLAELGWECLKLAQWKTSMKRIMHDNIDPEIFGRITELPPHDPSHDFIPRW
jgi:hypothetical protein